MIPAWLVQLGSLAGLFAFCVMIKDNCKEVAPFMVVVSWRRNSSSWLPQIPKIILSSAKAMRALKTAK